MITIEAGCFVKIEIRIDHIQAGQKALVGILGTGHTAATNGLKHASNSYFENILSEVRLKGTMIDVFFRNPIQLKSAPEFLDKFTQSVRSLRTFTTPLVPLVKQKMVNTVNEWRLVARKRTHHSRRKLKLVTTPS